MDYICLSQVLLKMAVHLCCVIVAADYGLPSGRETIIEVATYD